VDDKPIALTAPFTTSPNFGIAVMNQKLVLIIIRKGFTQLLCDPKAGRMLSDVAVQDSSAITKKQYRTPKVIVGTVKKSIAAIASR
jgi:hypothetical protein